MRPLTPASRWRSSVRRSIALIVRQAGQRIHRNQYRAAMAAPIVGENSNGVRLAWRSFQAAMSSSTSSSTWVPVACLLAASLCGLAALLPELAAVEAHFARRPNAVHKVIRWQPSKM